MSLVKLVAPAAFLSFALVACGGEAKKEDKPAASTTSTSTTGTTTAAGCQCAAKGMKGCDCAHCASSDHKDACPCGAAKK